jgi:hypothetical protein
LQLVIFCDAPLGNLTDGGSQGGYFIALFGSNGSFSLLTWQSKRIRRVVSSTIATETLAMTDAIDTGMYLASLFMEVMFGVSQRTGLPIVCLTDCHSLKDAIDSTKQVSEKRLRVEVSSIRELIRQNTIHSIKWI